MDLPTAPRLLTAASRLLQNELPLLTEYDCKTIAALGAEFDIDFIILSYTRTGKDIREARAFLDQLGMKSTKILAKVRRSAAGVHSGAGAQRRSAGPGWRGGSRVWRAGVCPGEEQHGTCSVLIGYGWSPPGRARGFVPPSVACAGS
jgi:hypothetical protein